MRYRAAAFGTAILLVLCGQLPALTGSPSSRLDVMELLSATQPIALIGALRFQIVQQTLPGNVEGIPELFADCI